MENRDHVRLVTATPVLLYVNGHGRVKGILQDVSQSGVAVQISEQSDHLFAEGDEIFMQIIRISCSIIGLTFVE